MRSGQPVRQIAVLGAGISGLVAAWELVKRGARAVEVTVLEASPSLGGKVRSELVAGQVVEAGPDSFLTTKPEMLELVRELGLEGDLIGTGPDATVSVLLGGRLTPLPAGMNLAAPTRLLPFALTPLFSLGAKLRMALEPLVPTRRDGADESLADFARRRLGPEALDRLVGPMLAGIYAGDPERMSVRSTFPQLLEMEKNGGLARALWFRGGAPAERRDGIATFVTLKGGLSRVIEALRRRLPPACVCTNSPARAVRRRGGRWEVVTPRGVVTADAVIAALPAPALADAIEGFDPEFAMRLRGIPFVSTATTTLIYDAKDFRRLPRGFGFLAPRGEGLTVTATTYSSSKFPGRYAAGKHSFILRAFVGGAGREHDAEGSIARIEERIRADIDRVLGLGGAVPLAMQTMRWIKANPQYEVGHSHRLGSLASCLKGHQTFVLAGASYDGVGLPDCVRSGRRAAELVFDRAISRGSAASTRRLDAADRAIRRAGTRSDHDVVKPGPA